MTNIDEYWNKFIKETGRSEEDRCAGDLNFEAKGFVGDELITLVLTDRKTAFFTSWATYTIDQEPLPVSGGGESGDRIRSDEDRQPQSVSS